MIVTGLASDLCLYMESSGQHRACSFVLRGTQNKICRYLGVCRDFSGSTVRHVSAAFSSFVHRREWWDVLAGDH